MYKAQVSKVEARLEQLGIFGARVGLARNDKDLTIVWDSEEPVAYPVLKAIQDAFGGNLIIGSERRYGGYCETCEYEYGVAIVTVEDWRFNDGPHGEQK